MNNEEIYFNKLLDVIHAKLGLNCRQYNESYIKRRINSRIMSNDLKINDYFSYGKILEFNPDELRKLFDALTINVTRFFRDDRLWDFLKNDVFPRALAEKRVQSEHLLTIWSCGCSSGEEPYSLALLLKELTRGTEISPKIIGTDIDESSINKAVSGVYDSLTLNNIPIEYRIKYFQKLPDSDFYAIIPSLKANVEFIRHNFFNQDPPLRDFDMIFCRNVIIYFTPEAKEKLIGLFFNSLKEHGWLILGESEILFVTHLKYKFYLYNEEERIYRRERRKFQSKVAQERRKKWWYGYSGAKNAA